MRSPRSLVVLVLVALLALTAFLLWPEEADDDGIARVDGASSEAVEETALEPIEIQDDRAQDVAAEPNVPVQPAPVVSESTTDVRRSLGDARSWRDVVRPIAVQGRALVEDFTVALFAADGTRTDFDADDAVAADRPRDDDLLVVLADGLCPRFVRGALLGPGPDDMAPEDMAPEDLDRGDRDREVMLVPRSTLVLHADTASPWFVTPEVVQVGAGREWENFHGEPARPSTLSMVDALRRLLDDDAVASVRAASLAFARAHRHFDAVTAVGGAGDWPDPFAPFALWQFEEPTAFSIELDPVAPNRRIELTVRGDALYHFDAEPRQPGFPVGSTHKLFEFKLRPGEVNEVTLLVDPRSTIVGRFPEGAERRTTWISGTWDDGAGASRSIGRADTIGDADPLEFESVPLAPGDYRFVGTWRVGQRRVVADSRTFELSPGERKDLGSLSATAGRSIVVRPAFRTFDASGSEVPIPSSELGDARFDVTASPVTDDPGLAMFDSLFDLRDLAANGSPLRFDGVPDAEWLVDAERFDPRGSGWFLVDTDPFSIAMPAEAEIDLPITLHRGEAIEVRLALPVDKLPPGSQVRASTWAHGRSIADTNQFRWVADAGDGPRFVADLDALPGPVTVEAKLLLANFDNGFMHEPWTARGEVLVDVAGRATLDLVFERAATVVVPNDAFPEGVFERRIEPFDGGATRLADGGGADADGTRTEWRYEELVPRTVYRLVGTDLTLTSGDAGSELVVSW